MTGDITGDRPETALDGRYSDGDATAVAWEVARRQLADAGVYWVSTVRPDGGPHVTPLLAVWQDGALHFCTGPHERKARNLAANPRCAVTTGCDTVDRGLDLVLEGEAVRVRDEARLRRLADAWQAKYGDDWRFEVRDEAFVHGGHTAYVFEVAASTAFAFGKDPHSQTRYRF